MSFDVKSLFSRDISRLKRFDFKNSNFESLKQVLLLTPLSNGSHSVNSIEDFHSLWDLWTLLLLLSVDTFVLKVNYKHSNRPPWISKDLAKDINKKKTLWRRNRNSKSPQQVEKFHMIVVRQRPLMTFFKIYLQGSFEVCN